MRCECAALWSMRLCVCVQINDLHGGCSRLCLKLNALFTRGDAN